MTAQIIDFEKKKKEKELKEILGVDIDDLSNLSAKELEKVSLSLYQYIIENAEDYYPSSITGYTTVMINGMPYMVRDVTNPDSDY